MFSVTTLLNPNRVVVRRYAYDAYGKAAILNANFSYSGSDGYYNEHLYTGRRVDPGSGLQLNRYRYYHASLGRWVNRDPIEYDGGDMNLYGYVGGRVTRLVDPRGLFSILVAVNPGGDQIGGGRPDNWEEMSKLRGIKNSIGDCLLKNTGVGDLLDKLIRLANWTNISYTPRGEGDNRYSPFFDTVYLDPDANPDIVAHELIHAYDDFNDMNLSDYIVGNNQKAAEHLAYAFQRLLTELQSLQKRINDLESGRTTCEDTEHTRNLAIDRAVSSGGYNVNYGAIGRRVSTVASPEDYQNALRELGLDVSKSAIESCMPCECE